VEGVIRIVDQGAETHVMTVAIVVATLRVDLDVKVVHKDVPEDVEMVALADVPIIAADVPVVLAAAVLLALANVLIPVILHVLAVVRGVKESAKHRAIILAQQLATDRVPEKHLAMLSF